ETHSLDALVVLEGKAQVGSGCPRWQERDGQRGLALGRPLLSRRRWCFDRHHQQRADECQRGFVQSKQLGGPFRGGGSASEDGTSRLEDDELESSRNED